MNYLNIDEQEKLLQFEHFSNEDAIAIGVIIHETAKEQGLKVCIDISRNNHTLFHLCMSGTTPNNARWMQRKRNTTCFFETSSLRFDSDLRDRITRSGLSFSEFAAVGGAFPVVLKSSGFVGAVVISGLQGYEDHNLAAQAIAKHLGIKNCPNAIPVE